MYKMIDLYNMEAEKLFLIRHHEIEKLRLEMETFGYVESMALLRATERAIKSRNLIDLYNHFSKENYIKDRL